MRKLLAALMIPLMMTTMVAFAPNRGVLSTGISEPRRSHLAQPPQGPETELVSQYLQTGESFVRIEPALDYHDSTYHVYYFTRGAYTANHSGLFGEMARNPIMTGDITGLLVLKDGEIVLNEAEIRQVLLLYASAWYLYEMSIPSLDSTVIPESFRQSLGRVTNVRTPTGSVINASQLLSFEWTTLFRTKEAQYEETFRQLLTAGDNNTEDAISRIEDIQDIESVIGSFAISDLASKKVEMSFQSSLDAAKVVTHVLWLAELSEKRMTWLANYIDAYPTGVASLGDDKRNAANNVMEEGDSLMNDALRLADELGGVAFEAGAERAVEAVLWEAARNTGSTLIPSIGAAASSGLLAVTAGNLLWGTDTVFVSSILAQRAIDLYDVFQAGRRDAQLDAASIWRRRGSLNYSGELAERFRTSYLLEYYAAALTYRSTADAVSGTNLLQAAMSSDWKGLLFLAKLLKQESWRTGGAMLRTEGQRLQSQAYLAVGRPVFLDDAVALALSTANHEPRQQTEFRCNGLVALVGSVSFGVSELIMMKADGLDYRAIPLPVGIGQVLHPQWSPDGSLILFQASSNTGPILMTVKADGSDPQILVDTTATDPAWSYDGQRIIYSRYSDGLYILDLVTGRSEPLGRDFWNVAWSPVDDVLALNDLVNNTDTLPDVFLMRSDGTDLRNLTQTPDVGEYVSNTSWSPDGTKLLLEVADQNVECPSCMKPRRLEIMDVETGERRFLVNLNTPLPGFAWAPDGSRILFISGSGQLMSMDLTTGQLTQITSADRSHWWPTWQAVQCGANGSPPHP